MVGGRKSPTCGVSWACCLGVSIGVTDLCCQLVSLTCSVIQFDCQLVSKTCGVTQFGCQLVSLTCSVIQLCCQLVSVVALISDTDLLRRLVTLTCNVGDTVF